MVDLSKYSHKEGLSLKKIIWYFINILFLINPLNPFSNIKIFLLRFFGAKIGKGVVIKPAINIKYPWHLNIGNNVWIGERVWIDNIVRVTIGDNSCLSQGSMILTGNHNYKKDSFDLILKEVVLDDGVWIGARAVVCPGVWCMSHSVLTAGSVATENLDSFEIYQGNPAVSKRKRVMQI